MGMSDHLDSSGTVISPIIGTPLNTANFSPAKQEAALKGGLFVRSTNPNNIVSKVAGGGVDPLLR